MEKTKENIIKLFEKLYNNFEMRVNPDKWTEILENKEYINEENKDEINYALIDFIIEHNNLPREIWETVGEFFDWREKCAEMSGVLPLNTIEGICGNMYAYTKLDYEKLPRSLGRKADEYINAFNAAYGEVSSSQIYKAQKDIEKARSIYDGYSGLDLLEAVRLRLGYDYDGALKLADRIIAENPKDVEAYINKGITYLMAGDAEKAYEPLKKGQAVSPNHYEVRNRLGECCMSLGRWEEAREIYLNLLYSHPYVGEFSSNYSSVNRFICDMYESREALSDEERISYAESLLYTNNGDDAWRVVQPIENVMLETVDGCLMLGHIVRSTGDLRRAIIYYETAAQKSPDDCRAYYYAGKTHMQRGNSDEAVKNYEKSIALDASYKRPYCPLANMYISMGKFDEARQALKTVQRENFDMANALNIRGRLFEASGDYNNAIVYYDMSKNIDQSNLAVYINKSRTLRKLERYREANNVCEDALDYGFRDRDLYCEKGLVYLNAEMYEDAEYWMDAALDEENPNPEVLFSKGVCAFNTDRKDEANELFKRAVAIDEGYAERVKSITEGNK